MTPTVGTFLRFVEGGETGMNQDYENGMELAKKMDEVMQRTEKTGAEALVDDALQDAGAAE